MRMIDALPAAGVMNDAKLVVIQAPDSSNPSYLRGERAFIPKNRLTFKPSAPINKLFSYATMIMNLLYLFKIFSPHHGLWPVITKHEYSAPDKLPLVIRHVWIEHPSTDVIFVRHWLCLHILMVVFVRHGLCLKYI